MNLVRHCDLCDHQKTDFKTGIICGFTDRKPEFNNICTKITFYSRLDYKLKKVNLEFHLFKQKKVSIIIRFISLLVLGLLVIAIGTVIGKKGWDVGVFSMIPVGIMTSGISLVGYAIGILHYYRQGFAVAKAKKNSIDEILTLYRVEYDINFSFGEEIHGIRDIYIGLTIKGRR